MKVLPYLVGSLLLVLTTTSGASTPSFENYEVAEDYRTLASRLEKPLDWILVEPASLNKPILRLTVNPLPGYANELPFQTSFLVTFSSKGCLDSIRYETTQSDGRPLLAVSKQGTAGFSNLSGQLRKAILNVQAAKVELRSRTTSVQGEFLRYNFFKTRAEFSAFIRNSNCSAE